ncbi:hypothetical protein JAAARDRAFT_346456 [Jaapia argillacea MUCL 33604]|uniref:Uncharacterized protein n=1 Tax=Jaapia argillacea MUCL 33604 TaxID=933084 RepID=A0A067PVG4_9AGAM|nr:hypothetical protein JAAARDRAFT_346456 [Jaapia argillacea MUCL 33604]
MLPKRSTRSQETPHVVWPAKMIQVLAAHPQLPPSRAIHSYQQPIIRSFCSPAFRLLPPISANYRLHRPRNRRTQGQRNGTRRTTIRTLPPNLPSTLRLHPYQRSDLLLCAQPQPPLSAHQHQIASRRTSMSARRVHSRVRHECVHNKVISFTNARAQHPTATVTLPDGFVVVGGGAKTNWTGDDNRHLQGFTPHPDSSTITV